MSEIKSDIQIAREAKMQPIKDILAKINVPDESSAFSPMGRHIAKINLEYLDSLKSKKEGKLIPSSVYHTQPPFLQTIIYLSSGNKMLNSFLFSLHSFKVL